MNMTVHVEIKRVKILLEDAVLNESYIEAYGALRMAVLMLAELVEALHTSATVTSDLTDVRSPGNDG